MDQVDRRKVYYVLGMMHEQWIQDVMEVWDDYKEQDAMFMNESLEETWDYLIDWRNKYMEASRGADGTYPTVKVGKLGRGGKGRG